MIDPADVEFEPWSKDRRSGWPSVDSGYLYSRHQLSSLDMTRSFVADLRPRRADDDVTWHLGEADRPNPLTVAALASWRSLTIVLSALDTYYWPRLTHEWAGDYEAWLKLVREFDPSAMLAWLGLTVDQLRPQIMDLHATAALCDDTGYFYDLIRRAHAPAWQSLRGDAAVAMDYRLAADVLARFAEDLDPGGDYAAAHRAPLSQQGVSARPQPLDATLTRLRVSPFPSLVIGVEGATEYVLVPKVLRLLGIAWDRNRIEIIDYGGTDRDLSPLCG